MEPIILASASPRRAELLQQVGIPFEVQVANYQEPEIKDLAMVETISAAKAREIARRNANSIVLGADTVVAKSGRFLGKPKDTGEAEAMLWELSGSEHQVVTGIALIRSGQVLTGRQETRVWLRELQEEEIKAYVASGEPLDKAGSYGIQGRAAVFVEWIDGCYFNVVGLPLALLVQMLKRWGIFIW